MVKFYEIDITNFDKTQLVKIFCVLSGQNNEWKDKIINLEMFVDDEERIIIRGWAKKKIWEKFLKCLIYDDSLNYIYRTTRIEDLG